MARTAGLVGLLLAIGCSSTPAPPQTWSISIGWGGGPPPGASGRTLLRSNGRYESTHGPKSGGKVECNTVLAPDAIAPVTAALARIKLDRDAPVERVNGSIARSEVIMIGADPYGIPSREEAPALWTAYDAAVTAAEAQCAAAR